MRDFVEARAGFFTCVGREPRQLEVEPIQLRAANRFERLPERDHRRNDAAGPQPRGELAQLLVDDRFRAFDLAGAPREVFADRRLKVIDVVEKDLLDFARGGLDVARDRDVDDEQRTPAPRPHDRFDVRLGQDRRPRAGRGDDDVTRGEGGVHVLPSRGGRAADRLGRPGRVRHRAADDRHLTHALRLHVLRRELAHLAGAEHDDAAALQVAENLAREADGGVADRDRARAEIGFRPYSLADGEAGVEEAVEQRPGGFSLSRRAVRLLHLSENLRLADDERVEAGGDAEQVTRGFEIGDVVHMRLDQGRIDVVERADERHQLGFRRRHVFAREIQLGAVAGREDRDFSRAPARFARRERSQRKLDAARLEIDALAQLDRRGPVRNSYE